MNKTMVRRTIRIPKDIHDRIREEVKINPHLSQNAVIVEALSVGLAK